MSAALAGLLVAAAFAATGKPVPDGPPEVASPADADAFERHARADGALVAMAMACRVPERDVRRLMYHLDETSLQGWNPRAPGIDVRAYRAAFTSGATSTQDLLARRPASGPGWDANCAEVRADVDAALAR